MDWNAKVEKLRTATIATVDALTSLLKGQRLYAICFQTADDGMSVGLCANTEEGYAEKRASEAEIEDMTPEYSAYLRWAPAEWRYEIFGDDHFADINRDLTAASTSSNKDFSLGAQSCTGVARPVEPAWELQGRRRHSKAETRSKRVSRPETAPSSRSWNELGPAPSRCAWALNAGGDRNGVGPLAAAKE